MRGPFAAKRPPQTPRKAFYGWDSIKGLVFDSPFLFILYKYKIILDITKII